MTGNQGWQRPESGSREGKLSNPRARPARARCIIFFFENLRNPARSRRAGLMRQFCPSQLDSTVPVHSCMCTRCLVCSISMRRVCRFSKFQNFTSSKPTFRIYVPSWLPTPVRKSRYQTQCNFLSNFETRDFCRVLDAVGNAVENDSMLSGA